MLAMPEINFMTLPSDIDGWSLITALKMRMKGLEPSLLSELEPKSSASANSATSASDSDCSTKNLLWTEEIKKIFSSCPIFLHDRHTRQAMLKAAKNFPRNSV